jgi:steroid delta-isomerase-like uncharacterized protein
MSSVTGNEVTIAFLEAFGEAWNQHDVERLMTFMAEECVFETTAGPEVCGKRFAGREAVRRAFERVFQIFPDAYFGGAVHFVSGNRGLSEWIFTGTPSDGKRLEVKGCDVFTFKNGKISRKDSFFKNRIT